MILTPERALSLLLDLFKQNETLDSQSVLVLWGEQLRDYEQEQIKAVQRHVPMYYAIEQGTHEQQSSDEGHNFTAWTPTQRYRVLHEDIGHFAQEMGVPLRDLMNVLEGRELEVKGLRSYPARGTLSRPYTPPRDLEEYQMESAREERESRRRAANRVIYRSPQPVIESDWTYNEGIKS